MFGFRTKKKLAAITAGIKQDVLQSQEFRERQARIDYLHVVARHYEAYSAESRRKNWYTLSGDADTEREYQLPMIRARARLMADNEAKCAGLIHKEITNTIGPRFTVQAMFPSDVQEELNVDDAAAGLIADQAERYWKEKVARPGNKDLDWRHLRTFLQYMRLAYRHYKVDGECFARFAYAEGRSIPFRMQIIEPECVGNPPSRQTSANIKNGLQFNAAGELEGFWVATTYGGMNYEFVPVTNGLGLPQMVYLSDPNRETASRGMPWLAPVLEVVDKQSDWKSSELRAKQVRADIALIWNTKSPDVTQQLMEGDSGITGGTTEKGDREVNWPKGQVFHGEKGDEAVVVDSDAPGSNYQSFVDSLDRDIGNGIGRSFERVSNNYGAANFSATRVSGVEDEIETEIEFELFSETILEAIWQWAMFAKSVSASEPLYRYLTPRFQRYVKPKWDPQVDASAATERLTNGTSSLVEEAASLGRDWQQVQDNAILVEKREADERKRNGLGPKPDKSIDATVDGKIKKALASQSEPAGKGAANAG